MVYNIDACCCGMSQLQEVSVMESQNDNVVLAVPHANQNDDPVEMYEEMIVQLRKWLSGIYPASKVDRALKIDYIEVSDSPIRKLYMRSKVWTMNNVYTITAGMHVLNPPGYLGCGARARKHRTGETWCHGNDLVDGAFSEETWHKIMEDIVHYEAEEVKSEKWKGTNVVH